MIDQLRKTFASACLLVGVLASSAFAQTAAPPRVTFSPPNPVVGDEVFVDIEESPPGCPAVLTIDRSQQDELRFFIRSAGGGDPPGGLACQWRARLVAATGPTPAGTYNLSFLNGRTGATFATTLSIAPAQQQITTPVPTLGAVSTALLVLAVLAGGVERKKAFC